jgi:hypothetical protein
MCWRRGIAAIRWGAGAGLTEFAILFQQRKQFFEVNLVESETGKHLLDAVLILVSPVLEILIVPGITMCENSLSQFACEG